MANNTRSGLEYYIYPSLKHNYFSLGDIIKGKDKYAGQFRVILTPHCHLFPQPGQTAPRADFVLTIKTSAVSETLKEKYETAKGGDSAARKKKLEAWSRSPAQTEIKPNGRHWYLPGFLEVPHLFCDFLQVESLPINEVFSNFETVATLLPPYAEALQQCFTSFYSSVGIPVTDTDSVIDVFN